MVGIGRGAESQMLLVLRHNMTDAMKVPRDSRSGEEQQRMWPEHMHQTFWGEEQDTSSVTQIVSHYKETSRLLSDLH